MFAMVWENSMAEESSGFAVKIFQMIAVTLIPFTRLLYIGDYQFERDWRQNSELNLALTTNGLVGKVNGWLGTKLRILRENTALSDVVSYGCRPTETAFQRDRKYLVPNVVTKLVPWCVLSNGWWSVSRWRSNDCVKRRLDRAVSA